MLAGNILGKTRTVSVAIALAKARTVPDAIPGPAVGMTTVQKILLSLIGICKRRL